MSASPSSDEDPVEDWLPEEELLERLELDGSEGMAAGDEEALGKEGADDEEDEELGIEGMDEEDEEEDELGIEGEEEDEGEDEELGIEGMPLLLLELCWVDSQPARTRASTDTPANARARAGKRWRNGVFMVASCRLRERGARKFHPVRRHRSRRGIL